VTIFDAGLVASFGGPDTSGQACAQRASLGRFAHFARTPERGRKRVRAGMRLMDLNTQTGMRFAEP
jgi:hypothetical protein